MNGLLPSLAPWIARLVALDGVGPRVVVGCSGGADSLALLALARATGLDVVAVYVDHGLRVGTDHDAAVVRAAARRFGAGARVEHAHIAGGRNLEARAREARHRILEAACREVGASHVLVGHTRDDQAETVLLNLLRGGATAGLGGMPARRGLLRRPLLGLRRAETREICARLGLAPVQDPMNRELRHRRVWLRREVLPRLERGARRDIVEVLARQADVLREEDALLDELAAAAVPVTGGSVLAEDLERAPRALARRAVRRLLGAPSPSLAVVERVLGVAWGHARAAEVGGGRRVERAGGRLHLLEPPARPCEERVALAVPGSARFAGWDLEAWVEEAPPVAWPDGRTSAVLDADRVPAGLVVRSPAPGERFRPAGGAGSKLVHDALAEAGVPASARARHPVLAAVSGAVVWVVGYRIDHGVRVRASTRRYVWVTGEHGTWAPGSTHPVART